MYGFILKWYKCFIISLQLDNKIQLYENYSGIKKVHCLKCLMYKHDSLSSDAHHPHKSQSWEHKPPARKEETGGLWDFLTSQSNENDKVQG